MLSLVRQCAVLKLFQVDIHRRCEYRRNEGLFRIVNRTAAVKSWNSLYRVRNPFGNGLQHFGMIFGEDLFALLARDEGDVCSR